MFQKEKKRKGCCTYSWPVSVPCLWTSWCQSLGVGLFGFFLGSFFLLFVFSLSFFSGFLNPNALSLQHCQSGHLRTCAQTRNLPAASARKSLGRFITLILTWSGQDGWIARHLLSCQLFKRGSRSEKAGHTAKNVQRLQPPKIQVECSCLLNAWENFAIQMPPV